MPWRLPGSPVMAMVTTCGAVTIATRALMLTMKALMVGRVAGQPPAFFSEWELQVLIHTLRVDGTELRRRASSRGERAARGTPGWSTRLAR